MHRPFVALLASLPLLPALAQDPSPRPEWALELDRKLDRKVTCQLEDASIEDFRQYLSDLADLNLVLDPSVLHERDTLSVHVADVELGGLLVAVAAAHDWRMSYSGNAVVLATAATIGNYDLVEPDLGLAPDPALPRIDGTIALDGTPVVEALAFLRDLTGLDMVVAPAVRARNPKIDLHVKGVGTDHALGLACSMAGARWTVVQGIVVIEDLPVVATNVWRVRLTLEDGTEVEGLISRHADAEYRLEIDGATRTYREESVRRVEFLGPGR